MAASLRLASLAVVLAALLSLGAYAIGHRSPSKVACANSSTGYKPQPKVGPGRPPCVQSGH